MNDDIRGAVAHALPEQLPSPRIDLDVVERRGESRSRNRRLGFAGLATAGVAAVAALAVTLPMAFAAPGEGEAASSGADSLSEYALPKLDPEYDYMWDSNGRSEAEDPAAAVELTERFWDHLGQKFPDLEVIDQGDPDAGGWNADKPDLLEPQEYPEIFRSEYQLSIPEGAPSVDYTKPVYANGSIGSRFGEVITRLGDDRRVYDGLTVEVHPEGGYIADAKSTADLGSGPKAPYLLEGCEDGTGKHNRWDYDFTCDETTGPGGEKVMTVGLVITDEDDRIVSSANSVIVTLVNGNAVVARDVVEPDAIRGDDEITDAQMRPELDFDELTDLALALPKVTVE